MNGEIFRSELSDLTLDDVRMIASTLHAARLSAAEQLAGRRAALVIEETVRQVRRLHDAASAGFAAATKVQEVALRGDVELPDTDVTFVARAAAQLARGIVVGDQPGVDDALHELGRGWQRIPCLVQFQIA